MAEIRRNNSQMTNDYSTGFADQEETSSMGSIEWTNEKHSLYLKSMEASFIDQLYNSRDLFSWCPPEEQGSDGSAQKGLYNTGLDPEGSISRMMIDGERHQLSMSFDEEVSDQNFVNNICENRAASRQRAKRPRTQEASATSNNDQVVPVSISHLSMQDQYKSCSDSRDRIIGRTGRSGRAGNRS